MTLERLVRAHAQLDAADRHIAGRVKVSSLALALDRELTILEQQTDREISRATVEALNAEREQEWRAGSLGWLESRIIACGSIADAARTFKVHDAAFRRHLRALRKAAPGAIAV